MKKITLLGVFLCFFVLCFSQTNEKKVVFDENAEERTVENFTGIEASGIVTVYISQGNENAVAVSCSNDKHLSDIITVVKNGVLKVYIDGEKNITRNSISYKAYVTVKQLEKLTISGVCNVKFTDVIKVENLSVDISGVSIFKGEVNTTSLQIQASGSCIVSLSGKTNKFDLESSGVSLIKAYECIAAETNCKASGASVIQVNASNKTSINASGTSVVNYKGTTDNVSIKKTGLSVVKQSN